MYFIEIAVWISSAIYLTVFFCLLSIICLLYWSSCLVVFSYPSHCTLFLCKCIRIAVWISSAILLTVCIFPCAFYDYCKLSIVLYTPESFCPCSPEAAGGTEYYILVNKSCKYVLNQYFSCFCRH